MCSAKERSGIDEIWSIVLKHRDVMTASGEREANRRRQSLAWMWSLVEEGLRDRFDHHPEVQKQLPRLAREVENGQLPPTAAACQLLSYLDRD
jgi:LAO/AO transport system kinase